MGKYRRIANDIKPALVMVVAQTAFAATNIFYKLAVMDGMNMNILIAYRFIFGSAFMLPLALFVERSSMNKLTWKVFSWSFLSGLVGASMAQLLYLRGLVMSSATFAMATTNLIPAMTFVLAITFRSEKLGWERWSGKAKVGGTLVGVVGAMTLTFYKGPCLDIWNTHVDLLKNGLGQVEQPRLIQIIGIFLCLLGSFCYASWLTMQVKINEQYPYPYTSIALMNLTASIQCTIYALCTERDWIQWKLGFNIRLFTSLYAINMEETVSSRMVELRLKCEAGIQILQQKAQTSIELFRKSLESQRSVAQTTHENQVQLGKLRAQFRASEDDLVKALADICICTSKCRISFIRGNQSEPNRGSPFSTT